MGEWLRDTYVCESCGSIPRQRAIIATLNRFTPQWKTASIYESSPCGASSEYIKKQCKGYVPSQYFEGIKSGTFVNWMGQGVLCENLEQLSFENESFDIVITQDVFEHIFDPEKAFCEIARVLKCGGMHIFTVPWYPEIERTRMRARIEGSEVIHIEPPVYHGNPVDNNGSLVTFDYGLDFTTKILQCSGMNTITYLYENPYFGLEAKFLEVFISQKQG